MKAICIGLGLLIVAALATIIIAMIYRGAGGGKKEQSAQAVTSILPQPAPAASAPGQESDAAPSAAIQPLIDVAVPRGSVIRQIEMAGNRVALVTTPDNPSAGGLGQVIVIDLESGKVLARLRLRAGEASLVGE
ncbi:hypothetical protein [Rhodoligotrophos ferricapiens]|uniref:hypothetical protein n=1 Tax=Rhodoligotrophos ferricapiens TaxID=3069264 RepID=UPI00315DD7F2